MKKIIGIFIVLLLIGTLVLPAMGNVDNFEYKAYPTPIGDTWYTTFGGNEHDNARWIDITSDGNYIIVGYTESFGIGGQDIWLIKVDSEGNEIWNKTFGGSGDERPISVQETTDLGFMIAGHTNSYGQGNYDVWLIKTDIDGNKEWDKTYGTEKYEILHHGIQISDGFLLVGDYEFLGKNEQQAMIIKTDLDGNEVWIKKYGSSNTDEMGHRIRVTSDGDYIVTGYTGSYTSQGLLDVWLFKTDSDGNMLWNKTVSGSGVDYGLGIIETSDYGYLISGLTNSYGAGFDDAWLIKTDSNGDIIWKNTYGGSKGEWALVVQQTTDGGFAFIGRTSSYGAGDIDCWLVKTDSNGKELWNTTFGGDQREENACFQQTIDGGYIVVGETKSFGAGKYDILLIKTDENGESEIDNHVKKNYSSDPLITTMKTVRNIYQLILLRFIERYPLLENLIICALETL
jgi:hypothetical protein